MSEWEEIQPVFRQKVLRRGEKTLQDVAEECHVGRRTLDRLMNNAAHTPRPSVQAAVERYVSDGQMAQEQAPDNDD